MNNPKKLSEKQKKFILDHIEEYQDLKSLTQSVWGDDSLDGRSYEGKAVKEFLRENRLNYRTTKYQKNDVELTDDQIKFIEAASLKNPPEKPLVITRMIFDDDRLTPLSSEFRLVKQYIDENLADKMIQKYDKDGDEVPSTYAPPESLYRAMDLINKATGKKYAYTKLNGEEIEHLEAVVEYINSHEFVKTVQVYTSIKDREFIEACLICDTIDKPDLTNSDLSRYIQIARDKLLVNHLEKQRSILNEKRNEELELFGSETKTVSVGLTEAIDKVERQYENAVARINKATKELEGQRIDRKAAEGEANKSILSLVKAMQSAEDRQKLLHIKKIERELVEKEIDKISDVGEEIAKIMGISKEEALA